MVIEQERNGTVERNFRIGAIVIVIVASHSS